MTKGPSKNANRQPNQRGQVAYMYPYIGFVKDNKDALRMGRVKVWIPDFAGDENDPSTWILAQYITPYGGATDIRNSSQNPQDTQTSFGFWFPPPELNQQVLVHFVNGDAHRAVIVGSLYDSRMNYMVPGLPGGTYMDGNGAQEYGVVKEYNKLDPNLNPDNPIRPKHPLQDQLKKQGLDKDYVRGINTTSARRESPSQAYGILTKRGHHLVFDDHDDENYVRLRTANGAQIMLNDKHGNIYVITKDGNTWIELTQDGRVDIYSENNINIHTKGDFNVRAEKDVNIEAGKSVNVKAIEEDVKINAKKNIQTTAEESILQKANKDIHNKAGSRIYETAVKRIDLNAGDLITGDATNVHWNSGLSKTALDAIEPENKKHPYNVEITLSINSIVPEREPWRGHTLFGKKLRNDRAAAQLYNPDTQFLREDSQTTTDNPFEVQVTEPGITTTTSGVTRKPFNIQPASDVNDKSGWYDYNPSKCSGHNELKNLRLSNKGVRHILQKQDYTPYTKTINNQEVIGYNTGNAGVSFFKQFPFGVTELEAVDLARGDLFRYEQQAKMLVNNPNAKMSQQQFDALVELVYYVGYPVLSRYTRIGPLISQGRLAEAGTEINQIVVQSETLSSLTYTPSELFNQCDYGAEFSGQDIANLALEAAYNIFQILNIFQQKQVVGASIKADDINRLAQRYPNESIIQATRKEFRDSRSNIYPRDYQLSKNFKLNEFTRTGSLNGNLADSQHNIVSNLGQLTENILEPLLTRVPKSNLVIDSGLRNSLLDLPHSKGLAVDIHVKGMSLLDLAIMIEESGVAFDQLVLINCPGNVGTVHVAYSNNPQYAKLWNPSLTTNLYLPIGDDNATYGGGWDSFRDMKSNPSKAKPAPDTYEGTVAPTNPLYWAIKPL